MLYYNPVASKKYSFNILIVGFGNIGKKHYKNLSENFPNTKLGILIKKKSKISKKNLSNFKNYVYYSLNDSLSFKPDLVLICTPANLHYKQVNFFLQNKVNIFVEKPIFEKLYNINKFQKIIKDNNLLFWVGYNLRYSKLIFQFKSLILRPSCRGKNIYSDNKLLEFIFSSLHNSERSGRFVIPVSI